MGELKLCSVEGCAKPSRRYGLCVMHASRLERHGDVNTTHHRANGTALQYVHETVLPYQGDECLSWPFLRVKGYAGYIGLPGGKSRVYACRYICEQIYGPAPSARHQSAHSCGNGHLGCVTPKHLRWASYEENCADTLTHGRRLRGSRHYSTKLTEDNVREIRALRGSMSQKTIGERFGVSEDVVSMIHRRRSWAWLDYPVRGTRTR